MKNKLGGVERVTFELAKELKKQGHEVLILTRKARREDKEFEEIENISIRRVDCINISGLRTITSLFNIYKFIRKNPVDINNPQDWSPTFLFLFLKKIPYVMTSHGFSADYENPNVFSSLMERIVLTFSKKPIICVQNRSNTNYLKKFKFVYIPNGVNTEYFEYSNKTGKYALFVGSIDSRKNIKRVCEAFSSLKKEGINIPLKVVGEGPMKKDLEREYPFVEFLGHKEGENLVKLYKNCKFFILPSTAEGFGLVWIEAMSCGKPVIASSVGVGPDIIKSNLFGRLVKDTHSVDEIKRKIKELNNQIDKKEINPRKIREFIMKNYSWSSVAKKYLEIYKLMIKK